MKVGPWWCLFLPIRQPFHCPRDRNEQAATELPLAFFRIDRPGDEEFSFPGVPWETVAFGLQICSQLRTLLLRNNVPSGKASLQPCEALSAQL